VDVYVGQPGYTYFQSVGSANNTNNMQPYPGQTSVYGLGKVGTVLVVTTSAVAVSGVGATSSVSPVQATGNSVIVTVGSISASSAIGTVS
jgi:hypothetical protein